MSNIHYIIETFEPVSELIRLFMAVDNTEVNLEFYIERIRTAINNYMNYHDLIAMLRDITLGKTSDPQLTDRIMNNLNTIIIQILYYIIKLDIQLPIIQLALEHRDLRLITEG